jgi:putative oxygen-independent coproporphyrinogen III oxidase
MVRHLYVHLPFCASRCGYCAFVVEVGALEMRDAYLDGLCRELAQERPRLDALETVYLGGGTPTLMRPGRIARLLDAIAPSVADGAEISIEANPETVDRAAFDALHAAGVTRVSIGAQSFQAELLAALDRRASADQVRRAVACATDAGFASVSVDLLFGIPGQSREQLEADMAEVRALGVDHISWYELEIKPETALARMGAQVPDEDWAADAYEMIVGQLEAYGYRWYETANFAHPGHECRHSLGYWSASDYLGLGVGAVSTVDGVRWRNTTALAPYLREVAERGAPDRTMEPLDPATRRRERWMLGLRLDRPLDTEWAGPPDHPEVLARLEAGGLLETTGGRVALTRRGRFVQNAVLHELMEYA